MAINVNQKSEKELVINLDERFDFGSVEEFRKCYESISGSRGKNVFVDFRRTRYMDSSALGMLINLKNYFSQHDMKIKLVNANDQIKKIFSISKFDLKFDIQ